MPSKTRTPEYRAWGAMKNRCHNMKSAGYWQYGAMGIRVCDAWKNSFERFLADVGPRPGPDYSLDRIDNSRGYEPGNVRWATVTEQIRNRSITVRLTHEGRTQTVAEWAQETGLPLHLIYRRIAAGWPAKKILTKPNQNRGGLRKELCRFEQYDVHAVA